MLSSNLLNSQNVFVIVLMASVNTTGNAIAGEMFTLTCSATRVGNFTGNVTLQWITPDGSQAVSTGSVVVGTALTSGEMTSLSLQFTTLFTSHGGEYRCQGQLVSQNTTYTVLALQDVIVRGVCYRNTSHNLVHESVYFFYPVPAPSVTVTGVPPSPVYAGTNLLLTCTFELHSVIDSPVTLTSVWRRGGMSLSSDGRVNVSMIDMINQTVYRTTLSISPISNTMDGGQYSCQSVLVSDAYTLYADASQVVLVRTAGMWLPGCQGSGVKMLALSLPP